MYHNYTYVCTVKASNFMLLVHIYICIAMYIHTQLYVRTYKSASICCSAVSHYTIDLWSQSIPMLR